VEPLTVRDLHKSYGDREVVAGISFELKRGECYGLLGPNGAGKTTTLRCCLGLTGPDAGTITLAGEPLASHNCWSSPASPARRAPASARSRAA
jgi:lipooligosaccharide transport system ATP-binding protein